MNKTAIKFKNTLMDWLNENNIPSLYVDYETDFGYAINEEDENIRCLNIGVEAVPKNVSKYLEQFFYEYGCEYVDIPTPILCFLHEVGHHMTIGNFRPIDLIFCDIAKGTIDDSDDFDFYYHYWIINDEMSANMWAINFINNHIEEVEKLCVVFAQGWNAICKEINPFELIEEDYYAA